MKDIIDMFGEDGNVFFSKEYMKRGRELGIKIPDLHKEFNPDSLPSVTIQFPDIQPEYDLSNPIDVAFRELYLEPHDPAKVNLIYTPRIVKPTDK